ncbi:MAG: XRE family transcriptional regulator, partial [candidate division Zixibacteria bacterium]|nr:XRE family transcriptional regulator [candidate division Zixibacteria bacterium]
MPRPSKHERGDVLKLLHERYIKDDPKAEADLAQIKLNAQIARQIYYLRKQAGLTQAELARKINTTASVICQLEDADYSGRSLSMLHRIATALGRYLTVGIVDIKQAKSWDKKLAARMRG